MASTNTSVLIVGAGPVGLLTALRLGQAGINTTVIEAHETILPTTRAMVYMPVVIPVLKKLGLMGRVAQEAYLNRDGIMWRDLEGKPLAHLPLGDSGGDEFGGVLLLGQYKMATLILEELKKYSCVDVRFGVRCGGIEDVDGSDYVRVLMHGRRMKDPDVILQAKYVLAADGANSTVRRLLCLTFDGFTYPDWKMIGADVVFDFIEERKYSPLNFIVHPEHWAVIAFTGQDENGIASDGSRNPLFRVAFVEAPDLPAKPEDYMMRTQERLKLWTGGREDLKVLRSEPYINSQRCASQAYKGRVFLAGDALHEPFRHADYYLSNNPIGGLGLTGGILDAFCYGNALIRVIKGGESEQVLRHCADSRRQTWLDITNNLSQANVSRLHAFDEKGSKAREQFFHKLKTDDQFPKMMRAGFDKMIPETFESAEGLLA